MTNDTDAPQQPGIPLQPTQPPADPQAPAAAPEPPATPLVPQPPATPLVPEPPAAPPVLAPALVPAKKQLSPRAAGLIGLAAGAALVGGVWAVTAAQGPSEPGTFTLEGTFSLTEDALDLGSGCEGSGGYDDIAEGASVTVYGAAGDVIATGWLGDSESTGYGSCDFDIAVPDVPKGEKFYKVEVSHRGTVQLTAEEAENGELSASLG